MRDRCPGAGLGGWGEGCDGDELHFEGGGGDGCD